MPIFPGIHSAAVQLLGTELAGSLAFDGVDSRLVLPSPVFSNPNRKVFTIAFWFRALTTTVPRRDLLFSTFPTSNNLVIALESAPRSFSYNDLTAHFEFQNNIVAYGQWTHANIRVDTTQPIEADRVIIEINGVPLPDPNNTFVYPQDADTAMFEDNAEIRIGSARVATTRFNGRFADFIVIEGQALPAAETNYDPLTGGHKDYSGSVGANGYRISPQGPTELGLDQSGNGFNFEPIGVTFDPIDRPPPFDVPQASLPVGPIIVTEGGQARADVTLSKPVPAGETVTVDFTVAAAAVNGATPITDFDVPSATFQAAQNAFVGTVTFDIGRASAAILIDTVQDAIIEQAEGIEVALTGVGGNVVLGLATTVTVTIEDDDAPTLAGSIVFNGVDEFLRIASFLSVNPDVSKFTISLWVKFVNPTGFDTIISQNTFFPTFQIFRTDAGLLVYRDGDDELPDPHNENTLDVIVPNDWNHLHFAVDTSQSSPADRVLISVNGVAVPTQENTTYDLDAQAFFFVANVPMSIGALIFNASDTSGFSNFSGKIADLNVIEALALTPDQVNYDSVTGGWKNYFGGVGTHGLRINPQNENEIGLDQSANGNDFELVNMDTTNFDPNDTPLQAAQLPAQVFRGSNSEFIATQTPSISINCGPAAPRKFIIIAIHDEGSAISNVQIGGVTAVQRTPQVVQGDRSVAFFSVLTDTLEGDVDVTYQLADPVPPNTGSLHAVSCWSVTNLTPTILVFDGSGTSANSDTVSCPLNTETGGVAVAARTSGDQFVDLGSFTTGIDVEDYDDLIQPFGPGLALSGGSASNLPQEIGRLISFQSGSVEANNVIAAFSIANVVPGRDIPPGATILELASLADAPPKPATK